MESSFAAAQLYALFTGAVSGDAVDLSQMESAAMLELLNSGSDSYDKVAIGHLLGRREGLATWEFGWLWKQIAIYRGRTGDAQFDAEIQAFEDMIRERLQASQHDESMLVAIAADAFGIDPIRDEALALVRDGVESYLHDKDSLYAICAGIENAELGDQAPDWLLERAQVLMEDPSVFLISDIENFALDFDWIGPIALAAFKFRIIDLSADRLISLGAEDDDFITAILNEMLQPNHRSQFAELLSRFGQTGEAARTCVRQ